MRRRNLGWYITLAVLAIAVFVAVYAFTGDGAVGAAPTEAPKL